MGFDYFYEDQSQQFAFYRIPKVLFTDARFQGISTEGKVLYGLLLDRVSLSRDNGWIDEEGRVYIIFTLTSIQEAMNCSEKSAIKYLSELEEFGLIERIKQGLGKPALIYVKNFLDQQNLQVKACKDYRSGTVKVTGQDLYNLQPNNTNNNNTEDRGCSFVLWKQNRFFEALGKKMTKQTASKLLHDGKVELKGCKSQKTGKTYDTTVVMSVDENKRAVFQLSFEKGEGKNGKSKNKKD